MAELLSFDWPSSIDGLIVPGILVLAAVCLGIGLVDGLRGLLRARGPEGSGPQPARPPAE